MADFSIESPDISFFLDQAMARGLDAFEDIACDWIKANPAKWTPWILNDYIYANELSPEQILMYCAASVIVVLAIVYIGWKLGFMDGLEAVLFDMMVVYVGKIVMDLFDILSDTMAYFTAVNGNTNIPMWFNICYVMIVGSSFVAGSCAVYFNAKAAYAAFWTRATLDEDVDEAEMQKIRARSSLWQGGKYRPRPSELHGVDDLEKIWAQEELQFAIKRIFECYVALGIAVSEDIPMLGLNVYLLLNFPEDITTFVYIALFMTIFFLGVRLNQFYKITIYRKQYDYAEKAHELHERQVEIQKGIADLAHNV